jgi:hypothetical protein
MQAPTRDKAAREQVLRRQALCPRLLERERAYRCFQSKWHNDPVCEWDRVGGDGCLVRRHDSVQSKRSILGSAADQVDLRAYANQNISPCERMGHQPFKEAYPMMRSPFLKRPCTPDPTS